MRLALVLLMSCSPSEPATPDGPVADTLSEPAEVPMPPSLRVATFNASLYRDTPGALAADLASDHAPARIAAAILQTVRPDVVLINEFDTDPVAAQRFVDAFLAVSQDGRAPLTYAHRFQGAVNTGVPSGVDLDQSGQVVTTPGSQAYGNDAKGFGTFEGQYGMLVLSRFPITASRTFQHLLWKDVPDSLLPTDWYDEAARAVLPLSSKSHWDLTLDVQGHALHVLASHPTPPTFDGPEDRNGRRNHDEIRFWVDYLASGPDSWHVDDAGVRGGLAGAPFVLLGDLNADPADGDARHEAIRALLAHPRVSQATPPTSPGAVEQATLQGQANASHTGDPRFDTADFQDTVGNLRVDYALPSADLILQDSGVFWPVATHDDFALVGTHPFPLTDHRLVWVDVEVP